MHRLVGQITKDHKADNDHDNVRLKASAAKDAANEACVLFLIDASGSMVKPIDSAIKAVEHAIHNMPRHTKAGVRVYGEARSGENCAINSDSLVPMQECHSSKSAITLVNEFWLKNQLGDKDLIDNGLKDACQIDFACEDGPKTIIVITDTGNSEHEDPSCTMRQLNNNGVQKTVDVIEVDPIVDSASHYQSPEHFRALAQTTGGTFEKIESWEYIDQALEKTLKRAVSQALKHRK